MYLKKLEIENHPILGNQSLNFINPKTAKPYSIIAFVGENACGKTTLLNLLFEYEKNEFIKNKETNSNHKFESLFIRQNSIYAQSQAELIESISGQEVNPVSSMDSEIKNHPNAIFRACALCEPNKLKEILSNFNDNTLMELGSKNSFINVKCGGEALKKIVGDTGGIDISKLSSGQQELIIKLSTLEKTLANTDCILLDEPETSLHPRWQRSIVTTIKEMLKNEDGCPQLFIATHSEKVLESLIDMNDCIIFRFSRKNNSSEIKAINHLNLSLPKTTFAELDYEIFKIPTFDYHDQLYSYFGELINTDSTLKIDKYLRKTDLYKKNRKKYFKKWEDRRTIKNKDGTTREQLYEYAVLSSYIRNYFHHPKDGLEPTENELSLSIEFLQSLIKEKR